MTTERVNTMARHGPSEVTNIRPDGPNWRVDYRTTSKSARWLTLFFLIESLSLSD